MAGSAPLWPDSTTYPSSTTYSGHRATGDKVYAGATSYPGSSLFPGQGTQPMHEVLMSFDDANVSDPAWVYVTNSLRAFTIIRGRENELATVDAGTETLTMDNRTRTFDPTYGPGPYYPNLRPMNRVWHRVRFAGETHDLFTGYVDAYDQQWPGKVDAVTIVHASDEFKVLALDHLPTTNPPRNSYAEVVQFDQPDAYWRMTNSSATLAEAAVVGPQLNASGNLGSHAFGAVIGEQSDEAFNSMFLNTTGTLSTADLTKGQTPEAAGLNQLTVETWVNCSGSVPAQWLLRGPYIGDNVSRQFLLTINAGGTVAFSVRNSLGYVSATSTSALTVGIPTDLIGWYHVVGVLDGSNVNIYINGTLEASTAWSGAIPDASNTVGNAIFQVGDVAGTGAVYYDELAVYRYALAAARISAHHEAGASRGFPITQTTGQRVNATLDSVSNHAPRTLDPGERGMQGRYMVGQVALEELRVAEKAEAVDALLFVNRRGGITFLDAAHRGRSGYFAPAITFSDDGVHLPYTDITVDYSESFLANEWNVTLAGGTTVSSSDTASIGRYFKRGQSLADLAVYKAFGATDDQVIADAMLAKYKDPMLRITTLAPKMSDSDVLEQVFRRDLGDRVRVIRTPDGTTPIDQQLFIQKIEISGTAQSPYPSLVFGVSPV